MTAKTSDKSKSASDWFLYIIEANDGSLYTGITTDVQRRFEEHKSSTRGARYFNGRCPIAVRYVETCADRSSASRREHEIKSMPAKSKWKLIETTDQTKV